MNVTQIPAKMERHALKPLTEPRQHLANITVIVQQASLAQLAAE